MSDPADDVTNTAPSVTDNAVATDSAPEQVKETAKSTAEASEADIPAPAENDATNEEPTKTTATTANDKAPDASEAAEPKKSALKTDNSSSAAVEDTAATLSEVSIDDHTETSSETKQSAKPKKKKAVGFAEEPVEELWQHHKQVEKKQRQEMKLHPFQKVPPELAYLEKKNNPGPQPIEKKPTKRQPSQASLGKLGDLRNMPIKELSVQNKRTEINFHHTLVWLPVLKNQVLVDVEYVSLQLIDLAKINRYGLNLLEKKVGLGYEYAGTVSHIGTINLYEIKVGDRVYGIIPTESHKGTMSSSLVILLTSDIYVIIDDDMWAKMDETNIKLDFLKPKDEFEIDLDDDGDSESVEAAREHHQQQARRASDATSTSVTTTGSNNTFHKKRSNPFALNQSYYPPMAKFSAISECYCRARQVLDHLKVTTSASVLINGGDTILAQTILQVMFAEYEQLAKANVILIVADSNKERTEAFIENMKQVYYDPAKTFTFSVVTFDMAPIAFIPGKPTPEELAVTNYKKLDYFAVEVIEKLFANHNAHIGPPVLALTVNEWKLDLFVDIIGLKKYFQHSVGFDKMDEIQFPVHEHLGAPLYEVFNGKDKLPLFLKLLKPKKYKLAFVLLCEWNVKNPLYLMDKLQPYKELKLALGNSLFNMMLYYNYYDELMLRASEKWCINAYQLVVQEKLKFDIDAIVDWRDNTRKYLAEMRQTDMKMIFKVEKI